MGLLMVIAVVATFLEGYLTRFLQEALHNARDARVDQLVRDVADADPEHGLGM